MKGAGRMRKASKGTPRSGFRTAAVLGEGTAEDHKGRYHAGSTWSIGAGTVASQAFVTSLNMNKKPNDTLGP